MAISIVVAALLPGDGGIAAQGKGAGDGKPENPKEWLRNKLKSLALLLGKLGAKQQKHCLASLGVMISWILNGAKEVVGWVLQNLWALVVGVRGLLYMYMVMRREQTK